MKLDISAFAHHKLHVFEPSMQIAEAAKRISDELSSSYKRISDQLFRASVAIPLLIGEGANRATTGRKRQRFSEARGDRPNWYQPRGHFCPEANQLVAKAMAAFIAKHH